MQSNKRLNILNMKLWVLILFSIFYFSNESIAFMHEFIHSTNKQKVEFYWAKPVGIGPFPILFLIHPDQDSPKTGGELFVKNGQLEFWMKKGFIVVGISQPGYGDSEGYPDFCGPKSQQAIIDVIKHFKSLQIANPNQSFIYGGSRGAVLASMVAIKGIQFAGVILKSGVYDFLEWTNSRSWYDPIKLTMIWEIGLLTNEKLKDRSAIYILENFKAPTLVIHGIKDDRAPLYIAETFAKKLSSLGQHVEFIKFDSEHIIPMTMINELMEKFMNKNLKGNP